MANYRELSVTGPEKTCRKPTRHCCPWQSQAMYSRDLVVRSGAGEGHGTELPREILGG